MFLQPAGLKVQRVLCWGLCYRYSFKGLQRQPELWLACTVTSASAHLPSVLWKVLFPTTIHLANLCMEAAVSWDCLGSRKVVGIPKGLVSFWCEDVKHPSLSSPGSDVLAFSLSGWDVSGFQRLQCDSKKSGRITTSEGKRLKQVSCYREKVHHSKCLLYKYSVSSTRRAATCKPQPKCTALWSQA